MRRSSLSMVLLGCAAIAALSCDPPQVRGQGGGARGDGPGQIDGGLRLPDASPAGQDGATAGAGGGPVVAPTDAGQVCAMEVHQAERVRVDLLVLLDVSASMRAPVERGTRSKAELVSEALIRFVKDPRSAGSGVGLALFPVPPPGGPQCDHSTYEKPTVPVATLPGAEAPLVQTLQNLAFSPETPMGPAVQGALNHLRRHQAANPSHRVALVLATDGLPSACTPADARGLGVLVSAASMETPSIATYAIGVFESSLAARGRPLLEAVATAGRTGMPFVLNSDPDLARTFQDALDKIRGATLPCEYVIPTPSGPIDFGKVNVRVLAAAGTGEDIPYVTAAAQCDPTRGGWYYDVDPGMAAPTRVVTCPATCDRLKTEPNANVNLVFGCKTRVID